MTDQSPIYYLRLNRFHRIIHVFVMVSFLGLALTGLPLKFSEAAWARYLSLSVGGLEAARFLHRVFAIVTFGYFITHLLYLVHFFRHKSKESLLSYLIGPNSMVPTLHDLRDLYGNVKWFIGLGPRPRFDRWTYWEKFDYWAVFWGVAIIGISGLFLWFPTFFTRFFPGWVLNVADIVHSDEALLAVGFIFIFHYIHAHLRGEKFPLDEVIFTGRVEEGELRDERPEEYERLEHEGKLASARVGAAPLWLKIVGHVVGFLALAVGLIIIILVIATSV